MANKNFLFSERVKFQYILDNRLCLSAKECARELNKSRSTIYYELKHYSENTISINQRVNHERYICPKLSHFPFVCNGCSRIKHCVQKTKIYDAYIASNKAHKLLVNSRSNTKKRQRNIKIINKSVSALIKDGVSIEVAKEIVNNCPLSVSTIRRYIEKGLVNVKRVDLPRTIRLG